METVNEIRDDVLRGLLDGQEIVSSVYFDLDARPEQEEDAELRWQYLAEQLRGQGADAATVDALARQVFSALPGTGVLALFAVADEMRLVVKLPEARRGDLAVRGPLPHLLPLLEWRQQHPAHVLAVVDRTGADLEAYPRGGVQATRETVVGLDDEIERNAPGGWSQGRFQNRAEDSWEHNAARAAGALARAASRVSARLVLIAGDVRAVQYLVKHLPEPACRTLAIRKVSGGRSQDGAADLRARQVEAETRRAGRAETEEILRQLAQERRPGGRAAEGVHATLAALAQGRVATLILADDPQDQRTAWFGPSSNDVFDRRHTAIRRNTPLVRGPLADVAVRAAVLTGAGVRVLPPGTEDAPGGGIGALCRYV